jgi:hypothetical protein
LRIWDSWARVKVFMLSSFAFAPSEFFSWPDVDRAGWAEVMFSLKVVLLTARKPKIR